MSQKNQTGDKVEQEQPFVSHLVELRDRLLRMVAAIGLVFLCLVYFSNDIYTFVAAPLIQVMPVGTGMIATEVLSPFLTPLKLTLVVSLFVAMPFVLYQLWAFVAPGLYLHERRLVMPLVASSVVLFYAGASFAYFVVFKLVFGFLVKILPAGVTMMTDIRAYLDFVLRMFFAFGLAFELPIAIILLVWMGITTPESLTEKRPYIVVGIFIAAMLLTPPDVISQSLLAIPMWLLFELGVIFSRMFLPRRAEAETADPGPETPEQPEMTPLATMAAGAQDPEGRYRPLTENELDAGLEGITGAGDEGVDAKLHRINRLRDEEDEAGARKLLYEVLAEGNEEQITVAKNILAQLDS
jgi:sec-independent protein translocase protein TatC